MIVMLMNQFICYKNITSFYRAARLTKPLGELLGQLLASLNHKGLSSSRLEMVGASLGAHVASYAAVEYYRLTGQRPARVTGINNLIL